MEKSHLPIITPVAITREDILNKSVANTNYSPIAWMLHHQDMFSYIMVKPDHSYSLLIDSRLIACYYNITSHYYIVLNHEQQIVTVPTAQLLSKLICEQCFSPSNLNQIVKGNFIQKRLIARVSKCIARPIPTCPKNMVLYNTLKWLAQYLGDNYNIHTQIKVGTKYASNTGKPVVHTIVIYPDEIDGEKITSNIKLYITLYTKVNTLNYLFKCKIYKGRQQPGVNPTHSIKTNITKKKQTVVHQYRTSIICKLGSFNGLQRLGFKTPNQYLKPSEISAFVSQSQSTKSITGVYTDCRNPGRMAVCISRRARLISQLYQCRKYAREKKIKHWRITIAELNYIYQHSSGYQNLGTLNRYITEINQYLDTLIVFFQNTYLLTQMASLMCSHSSKFKNKVYLHNNVVYCIKFKHFKFISLENLTLDYEAKRNDRNTQQEMYKQILNEYNVLTLPAVIDAIAIWYTDMFDMDIFQETQILSMNFIYFKGFMHKTNIDHPTVHGLVQAPTDTYKLLYSVQSSGIQSMSGTSTGSGDPIYSCIYQQKHQNIKAYYSWDIKKAHTSILIDEKLPCGYLCHYAKENLNDPILKCTQSTLHYKAFEFKAVFCTLYQLQFLKPFTNITATYSAFSILGSFTYRDMAADLLVMIKHKEQVQLLIFNFDGIYAHYCEQCNAAKNPRDDKGNIMLIGGQTENEVRQKQLIRDARWRQLLWMLPTKASYTVVTECCNFNFYDSLQQIQYVDINDFWTHCTHPFIVNHTACYPKTLTINEKTWTEHLLTLPVHEQNKCMVIVDLEMTTPIHTHSPIMAHKQTESGDIRYISCLKTDPGRPTIMLGSTFSRILTQYSVKQYNINHIFSYNVSNQYSGLTGRLMQAMNDMALQKWHHRTGAVKLLVNLIIGIWQTGKHVSRKKNHLITEINKKVWHYWNKPEIQRKIEITDYDSNLGVFLCRKVNEAQHMSAFKQQGAFLSCGMFVHLFLKEKINTILSYFYRILKEGYYQLLSIQTDAITLCLATSLFKDSIKITELDYFHRTHAEFFQTESNSHQAGKLKLELSIAPPQTFRHYSLHRGWYWLQITDEIVKQKTPGTSYPSTIIHESISQMSTEGNNTNPDILSTQRLNRTPCIECKAHNSCVFQE